MMSHDQAMSALHCTGIMQLITGLALGSGGSQRTHTPYKDIWDPDREGLGR